MNSNDANPPQRRSRWPVLALIVVFVLPISIAWLAASGVIDLGSVTLTNRGTLFRPTVDWREQNNIDALFTAADLSAGEWMLLIVSDPGCEAGCATAFQQLKTIRSLLGYSGQRVKVVVLAAGSAANQDPAIAPLVIDENAHRAVLTSLSLPTEARSTHPVIFVDWRRQAVEWFPGDAPPGDIKKDLKRLLRASKIR